VTVMYYVNMPGRLKVIVFHFISRVLCNYININSTAV